MRCLTIWPITRLSQVVSPTSSSSPTTQRQLTFSSRSNPATRCPCTCMTRSSATRPSAERSLHHRSFRSEKIQSLLSSQSLSVGHVRTGRLVEFSSLSSCSREKPSRDSENEQIRILLERQKEQILADCRAEIHKHEFQADCDRRNIQKLNGVIESQRSEINHTLAEDAQLRRDQQLLHEQYQNKNKRLTKIQNPIIKHGETCEWTTNRFVHTTRGNRH